VGAHRGEVAAVGQPAVEGPGDDLPAHRGADQLDAGALTGLDEGRLAAALVDGEALAGAVAAAGGGAAAQVLPARTGSPQLQDRMAGH